MAMQNDSVVTRGMNEAEKLVFSRTTTEASSSNTRVVGGNVAEEVRNLKGTSGKPMTLLGSGCILSLFAEEGLIDELQVMIDPVAVGGGRGIVGRTSPGRER